MKELVEVIAKALVDCPDEVSVSEKQEGRTTVLELHVAESDMGKVIGKQGRIAKAIRSVVKAAAAKEDKKVILSKQHRGRDSHPQGWNCPFLFCRNCGKTEKAGRKPEGDRCRA